MENIALAKKIKFKSGNNPKEGVVSVEPLFPGYGMTLGNSLRRVLLSSLSGAAVIGVKIKGASHEFMALPKIKEDVLEIILNLKQLRLQIFTDEEVKLELKVKGKKVVTAADITKNSSVAIKNPELVIAHLTESTASLEIEITVKEGRGYKLADSTKKENREIGYIEIDSIFSPVTLVSIKVENTRVGKMTNWDKLILHIKTDGTISPQEAFEQAVKILIKQYTSFLSLDSEEEIKEELLESPDSLEEEEEVIIEEELEIKTPKKIEKKKEKKEKVVKKKTKK